MELTEEEIKELKEQAKVETDSTNTIEMEVCNYETAQSLFDKLTEVMKENKELTLNDFMLTADTYWSGDDCYGNLSCSYEVPLTQDEMFNILKRNLINKKQRELEAYERALEIVKEYEERNK